PQRVRVDCRGTAGIQDACWTILGLLIGSRSSASDGDGLVFYIDKRQPGLNGRRVDAMRRLRQNTTPARRITFAYGENSPVRTIARAPRVAALNCSCDTLVT